MSRISLNQPSSYIIAYMPSEGFYFTDEQISDVYNLVACGDDIDPVSAKSILQLKHHINFMNTSKSLHQTIMPEFLFHMIIELIRPQILTKASLSTVSGISQLGFFDDEDIVRVRRRDL